MHKEQTRIAPMGGSKTRCTNKASDQIHPFVAHGGTSVNIVQGRANRNVGKRGPHVIGCIFNLAQVNDIMVLTYSPVAVTRVTKEHKETALFYVLFDVLNRFPLVFRPHARRQALYFPAETFEVIAAIHVSRNRFMDREKIT